MKPHDEPRIGGELSRKLRSTPGCDAKEEEEDLNLIIKISIPSLKPK
jgi:hypothetical protein